MNPDENTVLYGMTYQEREDLYNKLGPAAYFSYIGGSGVRIDEPISATKMNSDDLSLELDYWNTPAVSETPQGGGSLGTAWQAPESNYGMAADPTGALNLAAQTVTTSALAGGTLLPGGASGDVQPISSGDYGLGDFNSSIALALGDTVRQAVSTVGQVATQSINAGGQRIVAKVNSAQKSNVAKTAAEQKAQKSSMMTLTPTTMLVLAAVVIGAVVIFKPHSKS